MHRNKVLILLALWALILWAACKTQAPAPGTHSQDVLATVLGDAGDGPVKGAISASVPIPPVWNDAGQYQVEIVKTVGGSTQAATSPVVYLDGGTLGDGGSNWLLGPLRSPTVGAKKATYVLAYIGQCTFGWRVRGGHVADAGSVGVTLACSTSGTGVSTCYPNTFIASANGSVNEPFDVDETGGLVASAIDVQESAPCLDAGAGSIFVTKTESF